MSDSDAALVARTLGGDLTAYAGLMARYRDKFGRYAFHMLGNREDAQEALQDSFVRAYRSLASCRQPERFGAWLFRIVVNRCRTVRRRLQRDRGSTPISRTMWPPRASGPMHSSGGTRSVWRSTSFVPTTARHFCCAT